MATITTQRDLVVAFKKETYLNVGILSKLQPMPSDLTRQVFKENALEKPTQPFFNNLSYYLVCIIDAKASCTFSWPLYDTKTERAYRSELSGFLNDYSNKGLLSPVMSSYLVNPSCYKVTKLIFQLSQLAVQRILLTKINKTRQKELYNDMTAKYKQNKDGFMENIESETDVMLSKFSNYLHKRKSMERIAEVLRGKIKDIEAKLESLNCQKYIDDLVDKYIESRDLDDAFKAEIFTIKDVSSASKFFDDWLDVVDREMDILESDWNGRVSSLLDVCQQTRVSTESLIKRHTGEEDKSTFTIEYNPNSNNICTKDLQEQVNNQQKYILHNIVKENKLSFPNLIRGFLISIGFILKNSEIGDEIFKFHECLYAGSRRYKEMLSYMRKLTEKVFNVDARLEPSPLLINELISTKELADIPPLPDLSDLKANRDLHCQTFFGTFTPFSVSKHQFNLHRKNLNIQRKNSYLLSETKPKLLQSATFQPPRDDFLKNLISCRMNNHDLYNTSSISSISHVTHNNNLTHTSNETIAECTSGFTKQQILRLLSTKKSSSRKKFKHQTERPNINVKKGGLFNESNLSNESCRIFRSHSSPNLYENRERSINGLYKRKLSIMQENSPSILEVSGISRLEQDNSYGTPENGRNLDNFKNFNTQDATSLPAITVTNEANKMIALLSKIESDLNEVEEFSPVLKEDRKSLDLEDDSKLETPKANSQLIQKTSSLEKIINRFKKVRANVVADSSRVEADFNTIVEEKENFNSVNADMFTANKVLLPDLLSPSCSVLSMKTSYLDQLNFDMDEKDTRKPRESLGAALGVDQTFLDQYDLID